MRLRTQGLGSRDYIEVDEHFTWSCGNIRDGASFRIPAMHRGGFVVNVDDILTLAEKIVAARKEPRP